MGSTSSHPIKICCTEGFSTKEEECIPDPQGLGLKLSAPSTTPNRHSNKGKQNGKARVESPNRNLSLMGCKKRENDILVKHIRETSYQSTCSTGGGEHIERIRQLANIVHYAPLLTLKVINSGNLPKGMALRINAQGLENGIRGERDGSTYFGCKKREAPIGRHPNIMKGNIINDFLIPAKDQETSLRHRGRHFEIVYDINSSNYTIRDIGNGFGAFVKLDYPLLLKDNHLISMGESFMIVNLIHENTSFLESPFAGYQQPIPNKLRLKLFAGPANGEVFYFEGCKDSIKIGRMNSCEVQIDDNLLSKFQANIKYDEITGWILNDGFEGKTSTNGTWLYLSEDFTIYNSMIFKANQTLFQAFLN